MMRVNRWARRWCAVSGLLLTGLFLAGCKNGSADEARFAQMPAFTGASTAPTSAAAPGSATAAPAAPDKASSDTRDWINPGDTLLITFTDPALTQAPIEERVKDDGTIRLLENQTFAAAGKTMGQLEKEIHDRYVPKYFVKMTVTVRPKTETQFYYVDGEVKLPNRQVYISRTTVLKAIASAGGFTEFASKGKVRLTRVDGRSYVINCKKAIQDPRLDLEVFPGDKVYVPRRII